MPQLRRRTSSAADAAADPSRGERVFGVGVGAGLEGAAVPNDDAVELRGGAGGDVGDVVACGQSEFADQRNGLGMHPTGPRCTPDDLRSALTAKIGRNGARTEVGIERERVTAAR